MLELALLKIVDGTGREGGVPRGAAILLGRFKIE